MEADVRNLLEMLYSVKITPDKVVDELLRRSPNASEQELDGKYNPTRVGQLKNNVQTEK